MDWLKLVFYNFQQRLRTTWAMLFLATFSILVSVTLVSAAYIYSDMQAEAGLKHKIASASRIGINTQIVTPGRPTGPVDYAEMNEVVEREITEEIGWMRESQERLARTQRFVFRQLPGERFAINSPLVFLMFKTGFAENTRIVEGRAAQVLPADDSTLELEAVIGADAAKIMGWGASKTIDIIPFLDIQDEAITVRIVGIVEPTDRRGLYWLGDISDFTADLDNSRRIVPLHIPEEAYFQRFGTRYPFFSASYWWQVFIDPELLTPGQVEESKAGLERLEADINKKFGRSLVITALDDLLIKYDRDIALVRVPLFLFTSMVVALVLYLLLISVNLLAQIRKEEASLLRSRGATTAQTTMLLTFGEMTVVVLLAIALGPLLGFAINQLWLRGAIDPPSIDSSSISASLSLQVYGLGAIIGFVGLLLFLLATFGLTRLSPTDSLRERARPPMMPLVHRYHLDWVVLAFVGLVWWQARERGGFVSSGLLSGLEIDASLLISPALILLGASLVFLRLFPWVLKIAAWFVEQFNVAWASFAMKRMARNPMLHGSLALMVLGATALGIFGATFEPTLSRSQEDQANYQQGAPVTIVSRQEPNRRVEPLLERLLEAGAVTPIRRDQIWVVGAATEPAITVLAVEPASLPLVSWFRSDFADSDLPSLLAKIGEPQPEITGMPIPDNAESIGVWIFTQRSSAPQRMNVWARIQDAAGRYDNIRLGELVAKDDWQLLSGDLPNHQSDSVIPPGSQRRTDFELISVFFSGSILLPSDSMVSLDDITVWGSGLPVEGQIIEGFEAEQSWIPLPMGGQEDDTILVTAEAALSGEAGLRFTFGQTQGFGNRGIYLPSGPTPIPVIAGPGFVTGQQFELRNDKSLIPVEVVDEVRYFPTLDPSFGQFLLINIDHYKAFLRHLSPTQTIQPNEIWLAPGPDQEQYISDLRASLPPSLSLIDGQGSVESALKDPLAAGAWKGLTILGLIVLITSALLGLIMVSAVSIRQGRTDFSVARALGFSARHLMASLVVEKIVMVGLAMLAGTLVGYWLGGWSLDYLDVTPTGRPIVPPLLRNSDAVLLTVSYAGLGLVTLVTIGFGMFLIRRLKTAQVLREAE